MHLLSTLLNQYFVKARHVFNGIIKTVASFYSACQNLIKRLPESLRFIGKVLLIFIAMTLLVGAIGYIVDEPNISEGLPMTSRICLHYAMIILDCPIIMYGRIMDAFVTTIDHLVYEAFIWYFKHFYHRLGLFLLLCLVAFGSFLFLFRGLSHYRKHGTKWDQRIAFAFQMLLAVLVVSIAIWMGTKCLSSYFDIGFYWTVFKICAYVSNWSIHYLKGYTIFIHWPSAPLVDEGDSIGINTDKIAITLDRTHQTVLIEITRLLGTEHPNLDQLKNLETLAGILAEAIKLI